MVIHKVGINFTSFKLSHFVSSQTNLNGRESYTIETHDRSTHKFCVSLINQISRLSLDVLLHTSRKGRKPFEVKREKREIQL